MNLFEITCNDTSATVVYVVAVNIEEAIAKFKQSPGFRNVSDIGMIKPLYGLVIT